MNARDLTGLFALFFFATLAHADDVISWQHPTTRVNGSQLQAAEISSTIVRWRTSKTATTFREYFAVSAPANSLVVPRSTTLAGKRCYSVATSAIVGGQSEYTADVCKVIQAQRQPVYTRITP